MAKNDCDGGKGKGLKRSASHASLTAIPNTSIRIRMGGLPPVGQPLFPDLAELGPRRASEVTVAAGKGGVVNSHCHPGASSTFAGVGCDPVPPVPNPNPSQIDVGHGPHESDSDSSASWECSQPNLLLPSGTPNGNGSSRPLAGDDEECDEPSSVPPHGADVDVDGHGPSYGNEHGPGQEIASAEGGGDRERDDGGRTPHPTGDSEPEQSEQEPLPAPAFFFIPQVRLVRAAPGWTDWLYQMHIIDFANSGIGNHA